MKNLLKKIFTHLIFLIIGFILACGVLDNTISHKNELQGNFAPISHKITAPTGSTNNGNPFNEIKYLRLWQTTGGFQLVQNYINNGYYTYNGIAFSSDINVTPLTPNTIVNYALDAEFAVPVLFNFYNPFSIYFYYLGVNFEVLYADIVTADDENIRIGVSYTPNSGNPYVTLNPNDTQSYQIKLLRFAFRTNFTTGGAILQSYNYGLLSSLNSYEEGYNDGIEYADSHVNTNSSSYNTGYDVGYNTGYDVGYNTGYDDSTRQGISNPEHIFYAIWSILTTCGDILLQFFTIPIWGDFTLGFIFVIIPFGFGLIEKVIELIVKLIKLL